MYCTPRLMAPETCSQISVSRARSGALAAVGPVQAADLHGEPLAVGAFDVGDLRQLVVVDHRERQRRPAAGGPRLVSSRLPFGPMAHVQRGDQLLADGVQRRVGDLGEGLHEVVEEQARALGEHGDRRVGAHGAERLGAGAGHRAEQDPQFLGGVAEGALADG